MYYARAAEPAEGGSSLTARVSSRRTVYLGDRHDFENLGRMEELLRVSRRHGELPEKKGNVSIHLATAKQVIELGPVFVFNFGKGYRPKKLKGCDG